jgi:putative ABC transport system ATP-binding protein
MRALRAPIMSLLEITGLSKSTPTGKLLFRELGLSIAAGEFVAISGESGIGKSTLLNLIAGLDEPDAGSIAIDGIELVGMSDDGRSKMRRQYMGFVFQAFHLLPHMTLAQNVALPLILLHVPSAPAREQAKVALAEVGLADRADDFTHQLSGGEMQRVAIARALIHGPRLILADEPTGNLDPDSAARVLELFQARVAQHHVAVILVTHSEKAAQSAQRRFVLSGGGLMAC